MKETVLVNSPSPFLLDSAVMPPLGILYIIAALKEKGIHATLIDLALREQTIPWSETYGVTSNTPQFPYVKKLLTSHAFPNPDAKICIGGPHATLCPQVCLDAGFNTVVVGEGERAIFNFLDGEQGIIEAPIIKDLDTLSFPDRTLAKEYDYRVDGKWTTTIMTSRGCPFNCAFCCKNWNGIRFRSWQNIAKELEEIQNLGYEGIQFEDDAVWYNPRRDLKLFPILRGLDLVWRAPIRADFVTEERAKIMKSCGCKEVFIGVESGSDFILKTITKGITVKQNEAALKIFHEADVRVKIGIVLGLPSETEETIKKTWDFCERMEPYIADFGITTLIPYPGSRIYDHREDYDIQFDENAIYEPHTGGKCVVSTSALSREIIGDWRRKFYRRFKGRDYL